MKNLIKAVCLMAPIPSPDDGITRDGFGHEHFRFFTCDGFFGIESKKTRRVRDVPPTVIKWRAWFSEEELATQREVAAKEAPAS